MKILITGCKGQLGNELQLLEKVNQQHSFFNTDIAELDITNEDAVNRFVKSNEIDGVINCAAYTAVDKAESNEELCNELNAKAPEFLAKAIDNNGGWFVHISTDYVFDGTKHTPYVETDSPCPNSVYGRTKLIGEHNALACCKRSIIIRTAWLYSEYGNNFVKTMIRLGMEKEELGVIFDQIGTPTYAYDLAIAIMKIVNSLDNFDTNSYGIYHFSNEGVISWYDFTKAIHRIAGIKKCRVRPLHTEEYPTPASRPTFSVLDKTKIKNTFSIDIPYWEDSLAQCIKKLMNKN